MRWFPSSFADTTFSLTVHSDVTALKRLGALLAAPALVWWGSTPRPCLEQRTQQSVVLRASVVGFEISWHKSSSCNFLSQPACTIISFIFHVSAYRSPVIVSRNSLSGLHCDGRLHVRVAVAVFSHAQEYIGGKNNGLVAFGCHNIEILDFKQLKHLSWFY